MAYGSFRTKLPKLDFKEEFRPVIIAGKETQDYFISNYGNVQSMIANSPGFLKWGYSTVGKNSRVHGLKIDVHLDPDFFIGTHLEKHIFRKKGSKYKITLSCHKAVMNAFRPFHENLPDEIQKIVDEDIAAGIPKERTNTWLDYIYNHCITINHIDHNPEHNYIHPTKKHEQDNLEWCSVYENNLKAIEYRKTNVREDDFDENYILDI